MKKLLPRFASGAVVWFLLLGCPTEPPPEFPVILDFQTDGTSMSVTYRVASEEESTEAPSDTYHSYSTRAPDGASITTLLTPTPDGADASVMITVNGKTLGGSSGPGQISRTDTIVLADLPSATDIYPVVLDFQTAGTSMLVTYRVGEEAAVTQTVTDTYHMYSTTAVDGSTIVTRVVSDPATAYSGVTITVNGRTLGGSTDLAPVYRADTLRLAELDASTDLYPVVLDFQTDGTAMEVTYRVDAEGQTTETISSQTHSYSTSAHDRATVLTRVVATPPTASCGVTITVNGDVVGGSSDIGQVTRTDMIVIP